MIENECIICLENLEYNIAVLKCGHRYHFDCISKWINTKKNLFKFCPLCNETNNEIVNVLNVKSEPQKSCTPISSSKSTNSPINTSPPIPSYHNTNLPRQINRTSSNRSSNEKKSCVIC